VSQVQSGPYVKHHQPPSTTTSTRLITLHFSPTEAKQTTSRILLGRRRQQLRRRPDSWQSNTTIPLPRRAQSRSPQAKRSSHCKSKSKVHTTRRPAFQLRRRLGRRQRLRRCRCTRKPKSYRKSTCASSVWTYAGRD